MKILVVVTTLYAFVSAQVQASEDIFATQLQECNTYENVVEDYRNSLYAFATQTYKKVGPESLNYFMFSPLTVWITLAAVAEGADPDTKEAVFQFLNLPNDPCKRLRYYQLATSRYVSDDVNISSTRALVIDEGVIINPIYHNFVFQNSLLDIVSAPMRRDPQTTFKEIRRIAGAKLPKLDLSGNSIIFDALDINGFWTHAFEDAIEEKAPFYNQAGVQTGTVDLMRIKIRAKISYLQSVHVQVIELPIGHNERYRMYFGLPMDANLVRSVQDVEASIIQEHLSNLKESNEPIDIAIPRFTMTSEYDLIDILKIYSIENLWTNPIATRFISEPAALPSGFVQRATISLDKAGLGPASWHNQRSNNGSAGFESNVGRDFIANRPFLFGILDAETYAPILSGAFTQPTYTN